MKLCVDAIPEQYGASTTDPLTGLVVPKDVRANLHWRMELRRRARDDAGFRREIRAACRESVLFWTNAFVWTYQRKRVKLDGVEIQVTGDASHVPFVTWKAQDAVLLRIREAIRYGHDLILPKSRDVGFTWLVLVSFHHMWQFEPQSSFLEMSRKAPLVDQRGNMDTLMEKHRYIHAWLPAWMQPSMRDSVAFLENLENGSTITGESTNESAGQANRVTAILLDEFARMKNAAAIDLSTKDTSACRLFVSTHQGPGTHFRALCEGGRTPTLVMPWVMLPGKGTGAELVDSRKGQWWAPPGKRWTSPWYRIQEATRTPRDLAVNVDIDPGESGEQFFLRIPGEHAAKHAAPPAAFGRIEWTDDDLSDREMRNLFRTNDRESVAWLPGGMNPPWRLWTALHDGRPPQQYAYVFGVDIASGTGASNSIITVGCVETGRKVGRFASAFVTPEELADEVVRAALWWGGRLARPLLVHEDLGPGVIFAKRILRFLYTPLYRHRWEDRKGRPRSARFGWHPSPARKEQAFGAYRAALVDGSFINPDEEALKEAEDYVYDEHGRLVPAKLRLVSAHPGGGMALHGDMVVGDVLACLGMMDVAAGAGSAANRPAPGTYGALLARLENRVLLKGEERAWRR